MKVLVIRLSSMGDIVLTSPVLRLLKKEIQAEISFLTKSKYASLLSYNPYVDHVHVLSKSLRKTLKEKNFDLIIDLQRNLFSRRIRSFLNIRTIQYDKRIVDKVRILCLRHTHLYSTPVAQRNIDTLSKLGIKDDGLGLDFFLSSGIDIQNAVSKTRRNIVIVAGGTYVTKRIPKALITEMIKNHNWFFQLLGGNDVDLDLQKLISDNCYNGIGKLSWNESAAVISEADIVITGDTGFMHVAAAMQKPIIVLWGSTAPNFGFSPYYGSKSQQRFISISQDLNCSPCSKYGKASCPKVHMNCLRTIESVQIQKAIEELLR